MRYTKYYILLLFTLLSGMLIQAQSTNRKLFTKDWKFLLDSTKTYEGIYVNDAAWRTLDLPHDWSIEGKFSKDNPAGVSGGALPGGVGWYRKTFTLPATDKGKDIFIDFDGVYRNSEVWINGHYLGFRPNGFISFRYDLTPYVKLGNDKNVIVVKVDNSKQPNSRWYSGSGIYRNVWLVTTNKTHIDHWGTFVTTPVINDNAATVTIQTKVAGVEANSPVTLKTIVYNAAGKAVASGAQTLKGDDSTGAQTLQVAQPHLWSTDDPYLYKVVSQIQKGGKTIDEYTTPLGIRYFTFDPYKGFFLNGKSLKINGVCNHHDLGALGAAINTRAIERQLEILKAMGVNAIRTSHNPPAPELLELADKMGVIIMDEAFDMWKRQKTKYDYHLYWDEWHRKDLEDQVLRDRNHPSVMIWSIGNEIPEQWSPKDSAGAKIARELAAIVHSLDTTRPITAACNKPNTDNSIIESGALDLIGYNYHQQIYPTFHDSFPGQKFIATETVSALETRGHYDMPSDSIRRWPRRWDIPQNNGNPDLTVSAYDNVSTPWGSTHEETWKVIKKYDFLSGQFIWTGFDYLGEPTPYTWPARSSYFGIVDLAGFPKDIYYMYQSEWTDKPVLHILPHWNWTPGQTIDVWAYYNNADEVELFLNGKSLGVKRKQGDDLHVMWRTTFTPGTIKAVSRKNGKVVLTKEIHTAGKPTKLKLVADRKVIKADGTDLSFVTVRILDAHGNFVPYADNMIHFKTTGTGFVNATDNGNETSLEPFKSNQHSAYNGLALAIIQSNGKSGPITVTATADGLQTNTITIQAK